jgi:hypothetical protein
MSVYIGDEASTLSLVAQGLERQLAAQLRKQLTETVLEPLVKAAVRDLIETVETYHRVDKMNTEIHVHLKRSVP